MQIEQGGFTVKNAGIGTQTAAFIHQTAAGNIISNISIIDNPLCNSRQNALLFITRNWNPISVGGSGEDSKFGVFYFTSQNKWAIAIEAGSSIPSGLYFNVLIINP